MAIPGKGVKGKKAFQKNSPPIIKLDTLIECKDSLDWSNARFSFNVF